MKLSLSDENELFAMTGCLSTCDKYEFDVIPETALTKTKSLRAKKGEPNLLMLTFYFLSGRHEVKEQVIFYK